jgi:hypothetical protein
VLLYGGFLSQRCAGRQGLRLCPTGTFSRFAPHTTSLITLNTFNTPETQLANFLGKAMRGNEQGGGGSGVKVLLANC